MMFVTEDKTVVLLLRKKRSKWYSLVCFGRKRHYRKDGSCKHTEALIAQLTPDCVARTKLKGFGGKEQSQ